MERELFSWGDWDQLDTAIFEFYGIQLKQQIGQFVYGTRFSYAVINFDNGTLRLGNTNNDAPKNRTGHQPIIEYYDFNLGIHVKS